MIYWTTIRIISGRHYEKCYDLVLMAVSFVFINSFSHFFFYQKQMLKIDCAVSTRCHGKHTKYVSFLWPVVAPYDCKGLAQALPSSKVTQPPKKKCTCTQDSVTSVGLCRSRYPIKVAFATTIKKDQGQMLKHIVIYIYIYASLSSPPPPCPSLCVQLCMAFFWSSSFAFAVAVI